VDQVAYLLFQTLVECGIGCAQTVCNREMLAFHACQINALNMHQSQQHPNRLGHSASRFVARTATLGDPDFRPEFLLVQSESVANIAQFALFISCSHGSMFRLSFIIYNDINILLWFPQESRCFDSCYLMEYDKIQGFWSGYATKCP